MTNSGWKSKEPDSGDIRDRMDEAIEEAKSTPPSREFVQEQIDNIYNQRRNILMMDKLAAALQALLELIEHNGEMAKQQQLEKKRNDLLAQLKSLEKK